MTPLKVKVKRLNPKAELPAYAHIGDAGMDVKAVSCEYDAEYDRFIYDTGLAFEVPEGHVMLAFPRSSNCKTDSYLPNSVGVIDSIYRGSVKFIFKNRGDRRNIPYKVGDRIGQLMIIPYPQIEFKEVEELSKTERGEGGFGSTGS